MRSPSRAQDSSDPFSPLVSRRAGGAGRPPKRRRAAAVGSEGPPARAAGRRTAAWHAVRLAQHAPRTVVLARPSVRVPEVLAVDCLLYTTQPPLNRDAPLCRHKASHRLYAAPRPLRDLDPAVLSARSHPARAHALAAETCLDEHAQWLRSFRDQIQRAASSGAQQFIARAPSLAGSSQPVRLEIGRW